MEYRTKINDDLDLTKIEESGQCFRWKKLDEEYYGIVSGDSYLEIRHLEGNEFLIHQNGAISDKGLFRKFWRHYFDLGTSYRRIRLDRIPEEDQYLRAAAKAGRGIRILRQDPWEMVITFLLSQRKNIPAIKKSVATLCRLAGDVIAEDSLGEAVFAFPLPEQILAMSDQEFKACGFGYREKYIRSVSEIFAGKHVFCQRPKGMRHAKDRLFLEELTDEKLYEKLLSLYGVGKKVAECIMLFGFHRTDRFPKDVWINRVLENHYPDGFPYEIYRPYNGLMQQYLFYYQIHHKTE